MILKGRLIAQASVPDGVRVVAHLERAVSGTEGQFIDDQVATSVGSDGRFEIELSTSQSYRSQVEMVVLGPSGQQLASESFDLDTATSQGVEISVTFAQRPVVIYDPSSPVGRPTRLRGRVVSAEDMGHIADRQVVIWGQRDGEDAAPLFAARTDRDGYFAGPYPDGSFALAFGQVSLAGEVADGPVHLDADGAFPLEILLVLELEAPETGDDEHDDCSCHTPVPRAPDAEDLVNSSAYTADLGGCVDFTVPNRTLEEFSFYQVVRTTEPELRGRAPRETTELPSGLRETVLTVAARLDTVARAETSRLTGDATTEDFQAAAPVVPSLGTSHLQKLIDEAGPLEASAFKRYLEEAVRGEVSDAVDELARPAGGRARLDNRNRVPWEIRTNDFFQAATIAHGHILHFKQIWKADGFSMGDLLYSLPLAPCQKKQIAVLDWQRRDRASREESLEASDRLEAELNRDRDVSEIVDLTIAERSQAHSSAKTWSAGGGFGFAYKSFVIGASGGGGGASSDAWQRSSRDLAGSSLQQLRDRTTQAASSVRSQRSTVVQTVEQGETVRAETSVVRNHNHCHAITMQYFEVLRHFQVAQELASVQECLFVPLDMSRFTTAKASRWQQSLRRHLRDRRLLSSFDAIERIHSGYLGSHLPAGRYADELVEHLEGDLRLRFSIARPKDTTEGGFDETQWQYIAALTGRGPSYWFDRYLQAEEARDERFQQLVAPHVAEAFVDSLRFVLHGNGFQTEVQLDPTLVSTYRDGASLHVSLRGAPGLTNRARREIDAIEIKTTELLPEYSKVIIDRAVLRYRTAHATDHLVRNYRVKDDLLVGDSVILPTPLTSQEMRSPRAEDEEKAGRLLSHLNEHLEYYHRAIWWTMDDERRYMLLDGFVAPGAEGRSVASVVENRVIAIVGNSLVLPVAPGFHLDPTFAQDGAEPVDLKNHYAPTTPVPPLRLSVPTAGVYAESVMGACNSCEEKDETRFWRWEESPCPDEPTAIQPLSTDSRQTSPGDLTPQGFAGPIINLQNAPAAPDPTGLGAAMQVLGNSELFRDLTGLTENQKNALASYQSALQTAAGFGSEAASLMKVELEGRKAAMTDLGKTLSTIEQAQKRDMIGNGAVKRFTEAAFEKALGIDSSESGTPLQKDVRRTLSQKGLVALSYEKPAEKAEWKFHQDNLSLDDDPTEEADETAPGDGGDETPGDGDQAERYGGWDLRRGDRDKELKFAGAVRTPGQDAVPDDAEQDGFVRRLQEDLAASGFALVGNADGVFGLQTDLAVRELQIHAKMPNLADSQLDGTPNPLVYTGPVSGVLNAETRQVLAAWRTADLRCPVIIDAYHDNDIDSSTGLPIQGRQPRHRNVWRSIDVKDGDFRMIARDVSGHYPMPAGRSADQMVVGYYGEKGYGGPNSTHKHNWQSEGEILPTALFPDVANLSAAQRSSFKVVRAVSETECRGFFDGINAWDNVFLSLGPCHTPLGTDKDVRGAGLGGIMAYFEEKQSADWQKITRDCGIRPKLAWSDLSPPPSQAQQDDPQYTRQRLFWWTQHYHATRLQWQTENGFEDVPLRATYKNEIGKPVEFYDQPMNWFRDWHWYYRMKMAGRTHEGWRRALYEMALVRLAGIRSTRFSPAVNMPEGTTLGDVLTSEMGVALLLRWSARYPAYIVRGGYVRSFIVDGIREAGLLGGDPSQWTDEDESRLIDALFDSDHAPENLGTLRTWGRVGGGWYHRPFAFDPAAHDPAHPTLNRARGSFVDDDQGRLQTWDF